MSLPAGTHIGCVKLQVASLDRSLEYYETLLGFRVLNQSAGRASLGPLDDARILIELHERRDARRVPTHGLLGLYHFAILLPTRPALGAFLRHLGELGAHAGMSDHYVSEAIYLQDPDNLGIEVYADRPRAMWKFENGQLSMATVPLDVRGLLAAAGDAPWKGMPAGTVIGHMHLHVGDLQRAEDFYHRGVGFDKTVWSYPGALFMSAGGYHHHLGTNTWARGAPSATERDAGLLEWAVVVPTQRDAQAVNERLQDRRVDTHQEDGDVIARDPWGIQLRVRAARD